MTPSMPAAAISMSHSRARTPHIAPSSAISGYVRIPPIPEPVRSRWNPISSPIPSARLNVLSTSMSNTLSRFGLPPSADLRKACRISARVARVRPASALAPRCLGSPRPGRACGERRGARTPSFRASFHERSIARSNSRCRPAPRDRSRGAHGRSRLSPGSKYESFSKPKAAPVTATAQEFDDEREHRPFMPPIAERLPVSAACASVVGWPSLSSAQPRGSVFLPSHTA